jgi:hypothetical protein
MQSSLTFTTTSPTTALARYANSLLPILRLPQVQNSSTCLPDSEAGMILRLMCCAAMTTVCPDLLAYHAWWFVLYCSGLDRAGNHQLMCCM